MSQVLIGVSFQSSNCLHNVIGTHWGVLSIIYLSPLCDGYSLGCLINHLLVSIMSLVLIGVSFQSSNCLHNVIGTHWGVLSIIYLSPLCHGYSLGCLVNHLLVFIMSRVLIGCLVNRLLVSILSLVLIGVYFNRLIVSIMSWVLIGVSCQSSTCLHYATGTHWVSCQSSTCLHYVTGTHWGVLSIIYLSPLCHGYSLGCLVNHLLVSIMSRVLIGVSCQSSTCLHYVTGTHWGVLSIIYLSPLCHGYSVGCLVNRLLVSIMSWVLIGVSCQSSTCLHYVTGTHWGVLSIAYLSSLCHGYSLGCLVNRLLVSIMSLVLIGVYFQSSNCLHNVMGTHWGVLLIIYLSPLCHGYSLGCLVNRLLVSIMSWVLIGVSCQSSTCLHYVTGTHWGVLSIAYFSSLCHGYSLGCLVNRLLVSIMSLLLIGVSFQSPNCLHNVMGTHWGVLSIIFLSPLCHGYSLGCLVNCLLVSIMSRVLIGVSCQSSTCLHYVTCTLWGVLSIVYLSPLCHGYSFGCLVNHLLVSIMSSVLIGVSCQSSTCLHYVMGTYYECPVTGLFVFIMSPVLIGVSC